MESNKNFISTLIDIKVSDQPIFQKYSAYAKLWSQFFLYLLLNKVRWLELNETLCVFQKDFFDQTWQLQSIPLGKEPNVVKALDYLVENKLISKILFATEEDLKFIELNGMKITKSVKISEEFIYQTKDFIGLTGVEYKKIRQHVNNFKKNYNHELASVNSENIKEVVVFLETWQKKKAEGLPKEELLSFEHDFEHAKEALKHLTKVDGVKSLVVMIGNKVIGLSIAGLINDKLVCRFIMKALHKEYKGITEFILNESIKCFPESTYFTTGGYGKSENLRAYKEGLHPVKVNSINKIYF
jgi:hypothetical protein